MNAKKFKNSNSYKLYKAKLYNITGFPHDLDTDECQGQHPFKYRRMAFMVTCFMFQEFLMSYSKVVELTFKNP